MPPEPHFVLPRPNPSTLVKVLVTAGILTAVGGLVWYGVAKGAAPRTGSPTPSPEPAPELEASPWAVLEAYEAEYGDQDRGDSWLEAEGTSETTSGIPYAWRIYGGRGTMTDPEGVDPPHTFEIFQAIVMYQVLDGTWRTWGDNPDTLRFVSAGNVQSAADKIQAWADEN